MKEDLDKRLKEVNADLLNLRTGSITRAQSLVKALRRSDRKSEAKKLVELINQQAKGIARRNW